MRIKILGDGAWGTAISNLLKKNSQEVSFLNKAACQSTINLEDVDVLILAIPTQTIREVLGRIQGLENKIIVNCAKGIERNTHKFPHEIVQEVVGKKVNYFSLIGPSFAQEVNQQMPTLVNLGGSDGKIQTICDLFETDYFRVRPTKSVEALELSCALKNVYSIACGIADGLGFKINTRAKLITIAYEEFQKLASKLKYHIDEDARPGILGDLVLTCSSTESRNFRFGKDLTKYSIAESMEKIHSTIEGYNTMFSIPYFSEKSAMPLAKFVLKVIKEDNPKNIGSEFAEFVKEI
jgi:glycerol-3-phosphate dehydrogenase (NAD(P)+)